LAGEAAAAAAAAVAPSTASPGLVLFEADVGVDPEALSTCWKVVGVKFVVNVNE